MKRKQSAALILAALAVLALAASAGAVDGTIEINQAKVLAAGGFRYTISASGSYRLTGNLTVPASTNGINVTLAHNVTIDLNGFTIAGPGSSAATPIGINLNSFGATVENGTVTGFGLGVVVGEFSIVKNVHADGNASGGIQAGDSSVVEGCTANNSLLTFSGPGIGCGATCTVSGNTANGNFTDGIVCNGGSVISGNSVNFNHNLGIRCLGSGCAISGNTSTNNDTGIAAMDLTTGYGGNVLWKNTTDVSGGTSMGAKNTNLCSGTPC